MQTLKYVIGTDRRSFVKDIQDFKIDFSGVKNWLQARQYEDGMRQVFVNLVNEDGSPFDLTGCNVMFEGLLPDNTHRIMDAKHSVVIDPANGQFRFDFPKQAFSVAGSYRQAFFRIMHDGSSVTTLEFNLEVLADKVISGIVPSDYMTPYEDLYDKMNQMLVDADDKVKAQIQDWQIQITQLITDLNADYATIQATINSLNSQLKEVQAQIDAGDIITQSDFQEVIDARNSNLYGKNDKLDNRLEYIEKLISFIAPVGYTVTINHGKDMAVRPIVQYYEDAIGVENEGLGTAQIFGGTYPQTLAMKVSYPTVGTVTITLPLAYKLAGNPIYNASDSCYYIINGNKILKFDLGLVNESPNQL